MELINLLEIETNYGYRQFKLLQGDISLINFPIDLLCVSAFKGGYLPIPGTILGALSSNRKIDVAELSESPICDFRDAFGTHFMKPDSDPCIKHILCIEMSGTGKSMEELIENLLLSLYNLEMRGYTFKNIMLPLIGTGRQKFELPELLKALLHKVDYLLKTSSTINEINLVSFSTKDTEVLNQSMNEILGRNINVLPKSDLIKGVTKEILHYVKQNQGKLKQDVFKTLVKLLQKPNSQSYELAITSRKLCECVLNDIFPGQRDLNLSQKIQRLKDKSVAPWIISYFHLLRIFGNEYAHEQTDLKRNPKQMDPNDLAIGLFSLERIIEFYIYFEEERHVEIKASTL